jgi:hypothetical protein
LTGFGECVFAGKGLFNKSLDLYVDCAYNKVMDFQWDPNKAKANFNKHGVRFADAIGVFDDPYAITIDDPYLGSEQRFAAIGLDLQSRIIVVVYTYRRDNIRLISARKATKKEVKIYERGI